MLATVFITSTIPFGFDLSFEQHTLHTHHSETQAVPADATFAKANVATSATLGPPASIFADFGHFSDNTKEPETYTDRYGRTLFEI
jgi:hypothetical protein